MPRAKGRGQPRTQSPITRRVTRSKAAQHESHLIPHEEKARRSESSHSKMKNIQDLELENKSLKAELEELKRQTDHDLDALRRELIVVQTTQRQDVEAARTFLSTTDTVSDADIVGMAKSLNHEIHQVAAFFAGSVTYDLKETWQGPQDLLLRQIIGDLAYDALSLRNDHENHASTVQSALQACLTYWCRHVIGLWSFFKNEDQVLEHLHDQIRRKELPAIARTWRAMCREVTKLSRFRDHIAQLIPFLARGICGVLVLAGAVPAMVHNAISTQDNISAILEHCFMLDRAIEGMRSADVVLYVPRAGDQYRSEFMYDVDDPQGTQPSPDGQSVALTCELGVFKVREDNGLVIQQIMLKAGIQMTSTLRGAKVEYEDLSCKAEDVFTTDLSTSSLSPRYGLTSP